MMSIFGRSFNGMPGGTIILGPAQESGLENSDRTGSVRIVFPSTVKREVA